MKKDNRVWHRVVTNHFKSNFYAESRLCKERFPNTDRAIGNTSYDVVNIGFYAVISGSPRELEHNAKRYSLFITKNPRTRVPGFF